MNDLAPEEISTSELAKLWSVSPQYVSKLKSEGRIVSSGRGRIDRASAMMFWASRDPAAVATRNANKMVGGQSGVAGKRSAEGKRHKMAEVAAVENQGVYLDARARQTEAKAQREELELARLNGDLVSRSDVERGAETIGRLLQLRLKAFPARLGPLLAAVIDPAECIKVIQDETNLLMDELHDAIQQSKK